MRWKGETEHQRRTRLMQWHRHFALFPEQINTGEWVWLEDVWCRGYSNLSGGLHFEFAPWNDGVPPEPDPERVRPPPPVGISKPTPKF